MEAHAALSSSSAGKHVGGPDGSLSSKTCPPSGLKKHSLPQHRGPTLGIITRHLLKCDIMACWGVWRSAAEIRALFQAV